MSDAEPQERRLIESFKDGDVVRFKCGGPPMVVDGTNEAGDQLFLAWHTKDGLYQSCEAFPEAVELALPPQVYRDRIGSIR